MLATFFQGANWLLVVPVAAFAVNILWGFCSPWWYSKRWRQVWGYLTSIYFHERCTSPANYWELFPRGNADQDGQLLLAMFDHFQRQLFVVVFLVACPISAEQLPKSLLSTGIGFGPWQAAVVFWAGNWKWNFSTLFTSPLHRSVPPLFPPFLALRHMAAWLCQWWMISKTRSSPCRQLRVTGRSWLLRRKRPQFENV